MRVAGVVLIAWFATALVPGVGELVEDAVHVALDAHSHHASGEAPCPEHGCTPTAHHCSCCASLSVVTTSGQGSVPVARVNGERAEWPLAATPRRGFARRLLRPPAA